MDKIEWDESFTLGVPSLDAQNKKLVELFNRMIEYGDGPADPKEGSDMLDQIMAYSVQHFPLEEEYMRTIGFDDIANHQDHHRSFKKKICDCRKSMNSRASVIMEMREYLHGWIQFHWHCMDAEIRMHQESGLSTGYPLNR